MIKILGVQFPAPESGGLTATCNLSSRWSNALFWPPWVPAVTCIHGHTYTQINIQINLLKKENEDHKGRKNVKKRVGLMLRRKKVKTKYL